MRFGWKPYCPGDAGLVDSWLDASAIHATGLEDGWQSFYDYWMTESAAGEGKDRCFLISYQADPIAVMYIAAMGREITVSEFIVRPSMRGKGYGTAVIAELLTHAGQLLHTSAGLAKAVIFPGNLASIRAFEKAGFVCASENHDDCGDSLNYEYMLCSDR